METKQKDIIERLVGYQAELNKSDVAFARDHLNFSQSAWNRIKSGKYFEELKDPEETLIQLDRNARALERELALASRYNANEFHTLTDFAAVLKAISVCRTKPVSDPNRLVVYLAPTGGGKSALCGQIVKLFGGRIVEAREAWKRSYFTALRDIAITIGVHNAYTCLPDFLEDETVKMLKNKKTVIAIDEGEYFGAQAINLMKLLLNKTPTVIMLCAIPRAFDNWNRYFAHEASQLRRRAHTIIEHEAVTPSDAGHFLKPLKLAATDLKAASELLAGAANKFGSFDLCQRVATSLGDEKEVSLAEVRKAIENAHGHMRVNK